MENIKTKLEEEKKLLESEMGALGQKDSSTGQWDTTLPVQTEEAKEENELADRAEDYQERSSTLDVLEQRLMDVNRALESIENGSYGICSICQNKIESDRLEANTAAHTCKACMEK